MPHVGTPCIRMSRAQLPIAPRIYPSSTGQPKPPGGRHPHTATHPRPCALPAAPAPASSQLHLPASPAASACDSAACKNQQIPRGQGSERKNGLARSTQDEPAAMVPGVPFHGR